MQHLTSTQSFRNARISRIAPTVFGLGLLAVTATAAANPTYQVYFDGGGVNAGSVVALGGAAPLPEGVCGMRVSGADLLYEFYWAEYNPFNLGQPMPEPPFGPPSSATYDFPDVALKPSSNLPDHSATIARRMGAPSAAHRRLADLRQRHAFRCRRFGVQVLCRTTSNG
ncbi:MAG: hypothetical protein R3F37_00215 [Candidatus Competibacteraceae bacterium]